MICSLLCAVGISSALMGAVPIGAEKNEKASPEKIVQFRQQSAQNVAHQNPGRAAVQMPVQSSGESSDLSAALQVIPPQKSLESAVRNSEQGDILLMGQGGWYRIEAKTLRQGTRMYILGDNNSNLAAFPKEASASKGR